MTMRSVSTTGPKILEVTDLKTVFGTRDGAVHAVNGVSFHLREGELLGIVGESGSGKSVTMMSLLKLVPMPPAEITSGRVMFSARDLLSLSPGELRKVRGGEIGFIFQDPMTSLNPVFTVGFQLMEPLRKHMGLSKAEAREKAASLLALVGIPSPADRLDDFPHQFSGGMRQRVMIAIALACDPKLLIADEPTTALDVTIQAQILELVRDLRRELGMSMIWITHDLGVVAGIADRVAVMYGGLIVEHAAEVVGAEMVDTATVPLMGSEDFSYMLEERPGAYIFLGGGDETHVHSVHHPEYDYNDENLVTGASLWATLVERELPRSA